MKHFYIVIGAMLLAFMLMGNTGCQKRQTVINNAPPQYTPVEPVQPDPEPEPLPEDSIPTAGIGSIKGDLDCEGGTITTNYSFGNVSDDSKSFIIQYQRNGVLEDLTYPSTSTTGSRTLVKDIYYARQNDDKRDASWIVTISYQGADETYNLVTATLRQPKCEDNATAFTTVYEVK